VRLVLRRGCEGDNTRETDDEGMSNPERIFFPDFLLLYWLANHLSMPTDSKYVFLIFIAIVTLQLWAAYRISNYPLSAHKLKRKWIRIVLTMPLFGLLAYFLFGKRDFKDVTNDD